MEGSKMYPPNSGLLNPKRKAYLNFGNEMSNTAFAKNSHRDEKGRLKLEDHLKILQRLGIIDTWSDRKITAGAEWKDQIDENCGFLTCSGPRLPDKLVKSTDEVYIRFHGTQKWYRQRNRLM